MNECSGLTVIKDKLAGSCCYRHHLRSVGVWAFGQADDQLDLKSEKKEGIKDKKARGIQRFLLGRLCCFIHS